MMLQSDYTKLLLKLPPINYLHSAATYGDLEILTALLEDREYNVNEPDLESHCTALHKSIYNRQLGATVLLTKYGAKWSSRDYEHLTAWDYFNEDKKNINNILQESSQILKNPVMSWGTNYSMNLGIESSKGRQNPGLVKSLENLKVNKISINKFHSLALTSNGYVYSCGLGSGGRLGQGNEDTILAFTRIESLVESIIDVCTGANHSLALSSEGCVFVFGSNASGQIGLPITDDKSSRFVLFPIRLRQRSIKNLHFKFIACGNYHSVIATENSIYTFGRNIGQLGYPLQYENPIQFTPKIVQISPKDNTEISGLAASDACTVCLFSNNTILVCANHICKFYSPNKSGLDIGYARAFQFNSILAYAPLNTDLNSIQSQLIKNRYIKDFRLDVLLLDNFNILWRFSQNNLAINLCIFQNAINFRVRHVSLGESVYVVSIYGQLFTCSLPLVKKLPITGKTSTLSLSEKIERLNSISPQIKLERLEQICNIISIYTDSVDQNFFTINLDSLYSLKLFPTISQTTLTEDFRECYEYILLNPNCSDNSIIKLQSKDNLQYQVMHKLFLLKHLSLFKVFIIDFDINSFNTQDILMLSLPTNELSALIKFCYYQPITNSIRNSLLKLYSEHDSNFDMPQISTIKLTELPELYDVTIKCLDDEEFGCHKCVLIARSEYFSTMLTMRWHNSFVPLSCISVNFSLLTMKNIVRYLYCDEMPNSITEHSLYELFIASDHFLLLRLKEWCEVQICYYFSIEQVIPILELSLTYNAKQLVATCIDFICYNFCCLLSKGYLFCLDLDLLHSLSLRYQEIKKIENFRPKVLYQSEDYVKWASRYYATILTVSENEINQTAVKYKTPKSRKHVAKQKSNITSKNDIQNTIVNSVQNVNKASSPTALPEAEIELAYISMKDVAKQKSNITSKNDIQNTIVNSVQNVNKASSPTALPEAEIELAYISMKDNNSQPIETIASPWDMKSRHSSNSEICVTNFLDILNEQGSITQPLRKRFISRPRSKSSGTQSNSITMTKFSWGIAKYKQSLEIDKKAKIESETIEKNELGPNLQRKTWLKIEKPAPKNLEDIIQEQRDAFEKPFLYSVIASTLVKNNLPP